MTPPRPRDPAASAAAPARARAFGALARRASRLALAAGLAAAAPLPALAGPEGGRVKRGEARIETRGGVTTIRQGGAKVVIDWDSFDIAEDEIVRFLQPNRDATALNRVLDAAPSHIRGRLEANGNVWLINRHGVIFHSTSAVNVGGLLASTADITDDDFMAGRYRFGIPGAPGARVVNEGEISFADRGLVGLIGAHAENRGVIRGKVGQVVVAGAETYAVDLAGDGLFAFELDEATTGVSAVQAGEIANAGGEVLISAAAADALVDGVVSVEGVISADAGGAGAGGRVLVTAPGGTARVAGAATARGGAEAGDGGSVAVSGRAVTVTGTLDVSAPAGLGGAATAIAEETLVFAGTALARGFAGGGFIETSGAEIDVGGVISTGPGGTWLVDPTNVDIGGGDEDVDVATMRAAIEDGTGFSVETPAAGGEAGDITVFGAALAGLDLDDGVTESAVSFTAAGRFVLAGSDGITRVAGDAGALTLTLTTGSGEAGIVQGAAPIALGAESTLVLQGGAGKALPDFTAANLEVRTDGVVSLEAGGGGANTLDPADFLPLVTAGGSVTIESTDDNVRVVSGLGAIPVAAGETGTLALIAAANLNLVDDDGALGEAPGSAGDLVLDLTFETLNLGDETALGVGAGSTLALRRRGDATVAGNDSATFDTRDFADLWEGGATVVFAALGGGGESGDLTLEGGFSDATAVTMPEDVSGGVGLEAAALLSFADGSGGVVQTPGGGDFALSLLAATFDFDAGEPIDLGDGGSVRIEGSAASDIGLRNVTAGTLEVISGRGIDQLGVSDLRIAGEARFSARLAGDVTLGDGDLGPGARRNDFGTVIATTEDRDVVIDDLTGVILGDVSARDLTVLTGDGAIGQAEGTTVVSSRDAALEARGDGAGIALDRSGNAFAEVTATAAGDAVALRADAGDLLLGEVTAGSLSLSAAGAVDQVTADTPAGSALTVAGAVSVTAGGAVDLANTANEMGSAAVTAPGFAVALTDAAGALGLGPIEAASLTVRAAGAVTQAAGAPIRVAGATDVATTGGAGDAVDLGRAGNAFATVTVDAAGDVVIDDDDGGIVLDGVSGRDVRIAAQGDVTLGTSLTATGALVVSAVAEAGPAPDVDLTGPGVSFASVGAEAVGGDDRGEVRLSDVGGIVLERITAETLIVTTDGDVSQGDLTAEGRIDVSGTATLNRTAPGVLSVSLGSAFNDFGTVEIVGAGTPSEVTLGDATAITVGPIAATTALTVRAAGGIATAGALTAPTATFEATDDGATVALGDPGHDFGTLTLAAGGAATVRDADGAGFAGLVLRDVDAGSLDLETAGALSQPDDAAAAPDGLGVVVTGAAVLRQGPDAALILTDRDNAFGSIRIVDPTTTVALRSAGAVALDGIVAGTLTVDAAGTIGDLAALSAGTLTARTTGGGDVVLDAANAFGAAFVDAPGGGVALRDADGGGLLLGDVRAAALSVLADGAVSQIGGTSLGAAGAAIGEAEITAFDGARAAVSLPGANDFGRLSVVGSTVTVNDVSALTLTDSRATASLDVDAAGALTLERVSVDGAGAGVTLDASGASVSATDLVTVNGTTRLAATSGDVSLAEFAVDGLTLSFAAPAARALSMRLGEVGDLGFAVPVVRELTLDGVVFAGGIRGGVGAVPGRIEAVDLVRLDRVRSPGPLTVVAAGIELARIDAPTLTAAAGGAAGISTFLGLTGDDATADRVAATAPAAVAAPGTAGEGRTQLVAGEPALDGGGVYDALIDVNGTTTLIAGAGAVALDEAVSFDPGTGPLTLEHDFATVAGSAATGFAIRDRDGVTLGAITLGAGTLAVTAATVADGGIDGTGAAIRAPSAVFEAARDGADVTLEGPNDVDALTASVADRLVFRDVDGLSLGDVSAETATIDAATASAGDVTQTGTVTAGRLSVSTATAGSDVVLGAVNAVGRLDADVAGDLTFREADALAIDALSAGTATLETALSGPGDLTQTGAIDAGTLVLRVADGAAVLNEANAVAVLDADVTGAFEFRDAAGDLALAGVAADGALRLDVDGALTQTGAVTAPAGTVIDAGAVTLTGGGNVFGPLTLRTRDPDGADGPAPRGEAAVVASAGLELARLRTGDAEVTAATGDVTLDDVDAAALTVTAPGGGVFQTETGVTATGPARFVSGGPASGVILETSSANDFVGPVEAESAPTARLAIRDGAGDLSLGDLTGGEVAAFADGGSLEQGPGTAVTAGSGATLTAAGDVTLEAVSAEDVTVAAGRDVVQRAGIPGVQAAAGSVALSAGRDALLGDVTARDLTAEAGGDLTQREGLSTLDVAGAATLTAGGDLTFDGFAAETLTAVAATGAIAQSGAAPVTVAGLADLTAPEGGVTLAAPENDFGTVTAEGGLASVTLADANALLLDRVAGATVDVTAGGDLAQVAGRSVSASGPVALSAGGAATLGDVSAVDLAVTAAAGVSQLAGGAIDVPGTTTVRSGGPVALGDPAAGPVGNAFGRLILEASADGVGATVLAESLGAFSAVPAPGAVGAVALVVGTGDLTLERVEAGALDVTLLGGAIGQDSAGIVVEGLAAFETAATPGAGIDLAALGVNDFATLAADAGADSPIRVRDASAARPAEAGVGLALGDVTGRELSFLLDEGDLVQAPGGRVTATESTFVVADDAILTEDGNALGIFTSTTPGGVTEIESEGALALGDVSASDLIVRAGGAITQQTLSALLVRRGADVATTLGGVTLENEGNDFGSEGGTLSVRAPGDVSVVDADGLDVLGVESAGLSLTARAGAVSAADVTATGAASLEGAAGAALETATVGGDLRVAATETGDASVASAAVGGSLDVLAPGGDATVAGVRVEGGPGRVIADGTATLETVSLEAGDLRVRGGPAASARDLRLRAGALDIRAGAVTLGDAEGLTAASAGADPGDGADRVRAAAILAVARGGDLLARDLRADGAADLRAAGDLVVVGLLANRDDLAPEDAATPFRPRAPRPGAFTADLQSGGRVLLIDARVLNGALAVRGADGDPRAGAEVAVLGARVDGAVHLGAREGGPGVGDPGSDDPRALTVTGLTLGAIDDEPTPFGDATGETHALVAEGVEMRRIVADRAALLHLLVGEPGAPGGVEVVSDGPLGLRVEGGSALGDVTLAFADPDAAPAARTLEVFDPFGSAERPAGVVRVLDAHDVTIGRRSEDGALILAEELADTGALEADLFFAEALILEPGAGEGVDGIVLLARDFDVNERFLSDTRYVGLVLSDNLVYLDSPGLKGLDLAGSIRGSNVRAAGLEPVAGAVPSGPPPPASTDFLFNRCEVGNVTDCSSDPPPTARIDTPETEPPNLFVLDLTELADVYASFGNEELWAAPAAFVVDLDEPEEDDEDDDEDGEPGPEDAP